MERKEFEKLKPGDKVRIVSEATGKWCLNVVDKNNAPDVSAIYPAIEIISEHIHAITNVLTDPENRLDEIVRRIKNKS